MAKSIVIKIGTSSLTQPETGNLHLATIAQLVETIHQLMRQQYKIVLVSSGAVGVGCMRLGLNTRPSALAEKQAVAAVGQGRLMGIYDNLFGLLNQPVAQILVTRQNFSHRQQYKNIKATLTTLLDMGIVPIVNENDTVSVDELKFGDNDTLSALVASLLEADYLFLLTDVDYLYSDDPRRSSQAQPISQLTFAELIALEQIMQAHQLEPKGGSQWGTGGMLTKIASAKIASIAGVTTVICHGKYPDRINTTLQGESQGTVFLPAPITITARKRWIAYAINPAGTIYLDAGAVEAIAQRGKSLLSAGITRTQGKYEAGETVSLCDPNGREMARGIINYSCDEIDKIKGCQSQDIVDRLGYFGAETVIHRDDLVVLIPEQLDSNSGLPHLAVEPTEC